MCTLHAVVVLCFCGWQDFCKVWRIVPCVYKIYTLDQFQFHGLLKNIPTRFSGCVSLFYVIDIGSIRPRARIRVTELGLTFVTL
jgi:hypothetical protein